MRKVLDVVVVFIVIASVVSIFLFKGTSDAATGNVIADAAAQKTKEDIVFPNAQYDFRFCIETTDGVQVGVVRKSTAQAVVERYTLLNDQSNTYSCGKSWVVKTTN